MFTYLLQVIVLVLEDTRFKLLENLVADLTGYILILNFDPLMSGYHPIDLGERQATLLIYLRLIGGSNDLWIC